MLAAGTVDTTAATTAGVAGFVPLGGSCGGCFAAFSARCCSCSARRSALVSLGFGGGMTKPGGGPLVFALAGGLVVASCSPAPADADEVEVGGAGAADAASATDAANVDAIRCSFVIVWPGRDGGYLR